MSTLDPLLHALAPERWDRANRELVAKLLTELAYEDVVRPTVLALHPADLPDPDDPPVGTVAELEQPLGDRLVLRYRATRRWFGVWRADPATIEAELDGVPLPVLEATDVVALGAPSLGASAETTAGLVAEVAGTVLSDARQLATGRPAAELLDLDPDRLEGEMRGHPWIVANKGRVGFDAEDLERWAPESGREVALPWIAVDAALADSRHAEGLDHATVLREQVGDDGAGELRERAAAAGADPDGVVFLPVHPWQWSHRIVPLHAGELARREIVALGALERRYVPQLSIRTFADARDPSRRAMKLPLSILNTSVYRGLPREATLAAPELSAWLQGIVDGDPFLVECGLVMLGEVAAVSVAHRAYERIADVPYQHTEMLGALWRAPLQPRLAPGERAFTLAALLHRDPEGVSFAELLIARSGLSARAWVRALHEATLPPLLHVLYRYGATFSPHAQNCSLIVRGDVPVRLAVKDVVDDATVSADPLPELRDLPERARRALGQGVESMIACQWIQSGLLVCVHRYLAELLADRVGLPEAAFWTEAREAASTYRERFADELEDRYALFDLEAPAFVKLCLNRVRILDRGYAQDAERPLASAVGWVDNPLAPTGTGAPS